MLSKIVQRGALSLVLFAALFGTSVFPVAAASQPIVQAVNVMPGSMVRLTFANLPANVQFAVSMGAGGSRAINAPVVAHVYSADGSMVVAWIEILTSLSSDATIDVRVDNGAGLSAVTTFVNSTAFVSPSTPATSSTGGSGGAVTPSMARPIRVVSVEKGGIVVAAVGNLPANTILTVTEGVAGSQGIGGFKVGTLTTGSLNGLEAIGTFEIAAPLRNEDTIDLRLEDVVNGIVYFVNFKNVDM